MPQVWPQPIGGKRRGWHEACVLRKRGLVYLNPRERDVGLEPSVRICYIGNLGGQGVNN